MPRNYARSVALTCETCGKSFRRKPSLIRARTYCSIPCRSSVPPVPAIVSEDGLSARVPLQKWDGSIIGYTVVDVDDVAWAQQWRWQLSPAGRATRGEKGVTHYLHRDLLGVTDPAVEVDHFDLDPLNNRRANLRRVTRGQNAQNLPVRADNTSGHRGVSWDGQCGRWAAYVYIDGKRAYWALFDTKIEAAKAARKARAALMPFATD